MEKRVFFRANIDEDRLETGDNPLDPPLVDVADPGARLAVLDEEFDEGAILHYGNADIGLFHVD